MADTNRKEPGVSSLPPNLPFEPQGQVSHSIADPSQRETYIHLEDGNLNVHRDVKEFQYTTRLNLESRSYSEAKTRR
jgi:hypothetical protein